MPEHSENQMHGKSFENMIKAANGIFTFAAADRKRPPDSIFDIGAEDDRKLGVPTSIKTTGNNTVALADARMFWRSFGFAPYRIIIGTYSQAGGRKVFSEIHELILREKYRDVMLGSISEDMVKRFHDGLKKFGVGSHEQAREWAREQKHQLESDFGLVTLNPKIDSKNQRRLQCSIPLAALIRAVDAGDYELHSDRFGNLPLPAQIISGARKLKKKTP